MATTIAELEVKIKSELDKLKKDVDKLGTQLKGTKKETDTFASNFTSKFKSLVNPVTIALGAIALFTVGLKKSIDAAIVQENAIAKLNAVLASTKGVAGVTSKSAQELASSLQKVTTYGDETIISAESILLTFTKIGKDVFPEAVETMLDMSTVLGQDLKSSAIQLGKALNDPIQGVTALRRVGVQLTAEQENSIKKFMQLGDVASAQKVILQELGTQMGGQARAAAETYGGRVQQLKNSMGDFAENIGNFVIPALNQLIPILTEGSEKLADFASHFSVMNAKIQGTKNFLEDNAKVIKELENRYEELSKKRSEVTDKEKDELADLTNKLRQLYALRKKATTELDQLEGKSVENNKKNTNFKKELTEEEIKEKEKQKNEFLKIDSELNLKLLEQSGNRDLILKEQERLALDEIKNYSTISTTKKEQLKTRITKYYAEERKKAEILKNLETANKILSITQNLTSQLSAIFTQYTTNKLTELENERTIEQEKLDESYESRKKWIENNISDEEERSKALSELDENYNRNSEELARKSDKEKRKIQREAAEKTKAIAVVNSIINTALGITQALATIPPPYSWVVAAITAALGAVQTGLILSQPLPAAAEGMFGNTPFIAGEAGREIAVPLDSDQGRGAIRELASGMLDVMSQMVDTRATMTKKTNNSSDRTVGVYLDGTLVGKWISKASSNGAFTLSRRVII